MHDTDQARISIFLFPVFSLKAISQISPRKKITKQKGLTSTLLSSLLGYIFGRQMYTEKRAHFPFYMVDL